MAHSYRLGLVTWSYQVRIPVGSDICHRGCAYTVPQTIQRHGVHSVVYGTVHYKEPLKSFEIIIIIIIIINNGEFLYSAHTMLCALHTYYPWSLDLFIHVPFQPPTALAAISALATSRSHCHLCPTRYHLHLSQVKHVRIKCLAQGHNIEIMSQYGKERNIIFLWKSCTKRDSKPHGKQWHWQSSAL